MFAYLFWAFLSFLSGSVMYSYLIPKILYKKDITKISKDGNPGCGNVFTCIGIPCGILCLLLELAKGALPVWLSLRYLNPGNLMFAGVMAAPVLGHAFSPMLKNHGGKAIAVTFGALIGLCTHSALLFILAASLVVFSVIIRITPHSLRVMTSYLVTAIGAVLLLRDPVICLGTFIITAVVVYRHIGDFLNREKGRFSVYILTLRLFGSTDEEKELSHTGKV